MSRTTTSRATGAKAALVGQPSAARSSAGGSGREAASSEACDLGLVQARVRPLEIEAAEAPMPRLVAQDGLVDRARQLVGRLRARHGRSAPAEGFGDAP